MEGVRRENIDQDDDKESYIEDTCDRNGGIWSKNKMRIGKYINMENFKFRDLQNF